MGAPRRHPCRAHTGSGSSASGTRLVERIQNVVNLTLARGYLKKLFDNGKVVRWLAQRQAEVLGELQKVVDANSLEA
jgi:hypothetical protein